MGDKSRKPKPIVIVIIYTVKPYNGLMKNGRLITEVSELRFTLSELKSVNIKDSANYSAAQKELLLAKKNIEEMGIKLNNAELF